MTGYDDGEFKGGQSITRGEFAAMLARYIGLEAAADLGGYPFSDAGSHWAQGYIQALYNAGILGGYPDGTFRPDAKITRAEAAKMVNAALGRTPDGELVSGAEPVYADVSRGEWYYGDVMEASVVHEIEAYHKQETKN